MYKNLFPKLFVISQLNKFRFYSKKVPKNLKGKSKSSQEWLSRQLSDPYVERAHRMNYRCRSVFKLIEIDDKFKIIKPGSIVVDCGAAPGSWSQLAVERCNATAEKPQQAVGAVFSLDLLHFHAIKGATIFGGMDFTLPASQQRLKSALGNKLVNCVISDMAPNATGVRMLDQENIINLCYEVLRFAFTISAPHANLVVKVWDNARVAQLERDMAKFYEKVKRFKPDSSRSDSSEQFLVARGFNSMLTESNNTDKT